MLDKTLDSEILEHGSHSAIAENAGRYLGQSLAFQSIKSYSNELIKTLN
jgi:hypothetical protein